MPHNRYYVKKPFCKDELVSIDDLEFQHMTRVMRQKKGDEIELINGKGQLATGNVADIEKRQATILITNVQNDMLCDFSLTLTLALLKPTHLEFAIEKAVELGVTEIVLFAGKRSEKKEVSDQYMIRLTSIIISACKQCGRLFLPKLVIKKSLKECLAPEQPAFFGDINKDARALTSFSEEIKNKRMANLYIGPESGFSEDEIKLMQNAGFHGISFHPNILRAETAAIAGITLFSNLLYATETKK